VPADGTSAVKLKKRRLHFVAVLWATLRQAIRLTVGARYASFELLSSNAPAACLLRAQPTVPQARLLEAAKEVMAGGPRRVPPATHLEWTVRREPLPSLTRWRTTSADGR
jgi:hypothetical protein